MEWMRLSEGRKRKHHNGNQISYFVCPWSTHIYIILEQRSKGGGCTGRWGAWQEGGVWVAGFEYWVVCLERMGIAEVI